MPSPFPGMDPYLEHPSRWAEVHGSLIWRVHEALNSLLPERYVAHVDRYVWLEEAGGQGRVRDGLPDVYVRDDGERTAGPVALAAPRTIVLPQPTVRTERNRFVRIVDSERRRVVTVVEILSHSNKEAGSDRDAYLLKRQEYFALQTNVVEFDLLRAAERMPLGQPDPMPGGYLVLVCPATNFPDAGLWGFGVREPIPPIPVPLDAADAPVTLDLKPLLERTYDVGRYSREIDYSRPPVPRLADADAEWARRLLASRPHT